MEYKSIFSAIGAAIMIASYIPYYYAIYKGSAKPHAITWFIWGTLSCIAFAAQVKENAGVGAWVLGASVALMLSVFILALFYGTKDVKAADWYSLAGAGLALTLWFFSDNVLNSVLLAALIDSIGYFPTWRKSWKKPDSEPILAYIASTMSFALALLALESYEFVNWIYIAMIMTMNLITVIFLYLRRRRIRLKKLT